MVHPVEDPVLILYDSSSSSFCLKMLQTFFQRLILCCHLSNTFLVLYLKWCSVLIFTRPHLPCYYFLLVYNIWCFIRIFWVFTSTNSVFSYCHLIMLATLYMIGRNTCLWLGFCFSHWIGASESVLLFLVFGFCFLLCLFTVVSIWFWDTKVLVAICATLIISFHE